MKTYIIEKIRTINIIDIIIYKRWMTSYFVGGKKQIAPLSITIVINNRKTYNCKSVWIMLSKVGGKYKVRNHGKWDDELVADTNREQFTFINKIIETNYYLHVT